MRSQLEDDGVNRAVFAATPWTKFEFLDAALNLEHPIDAFAGLDSEIYHNVFWQLTVGPVEVNRYRAAIMKEFEHVLTHTQESDFDIH